MTLTIPFQFVWFLYRYYWPKFKPGEVCRVRGEAEPVLVRIVETEPLFIGCKRQYRVTSPDAYWFVLRQRDPIKQYMMVFVDEEDLEKVSDLEKILYE